MKQDSSSPLDASPASLNLPHFVAALLSACAVALLALPASPLFAADVTWDRGAGTTAWASGTNWDTNTAPAVGDNTFFGDVGAGDVSMGNTTREANSLTLQNTGATTYDFINGGTSGRLRTSRVTNNSTTSAGNFISTRMNARGTGTTNTLTLNGDGAAWLTISQIDDQSGTRATAVTKAGTSTVILSGSSTYTAATNVNAGTLLVNGSTAAASIVTVGASGTLGGIGVINGDVTVNGGTLSPGASIESLGVGNITFTGGTFLYEIDRNAAAGSRADLLFASDTSAGLTLSGFPTLSLVDLNLGSPFALGTKFTLFSYTAAPNWNGGTFSGLADDSTFSFAGNTWQINYDDLVAGTNFASDAVSFGDRFTTITVVPEPSTFPMLVGGLGLLLGFHRRGSRR